MTVTRTEDAIPIEVALLIYANEENLQSYLRDNLWAADYSV